jgi:CSLREA domain-containing protein
LAARFSDLSISGSLVRSNSSRTGGGGIWSGGSLEVSNSTISNNAATNSSNVASGGGILRVGTSPESTITVSNSTITDNFADSLGGGFYTNGPSRLFGALIAGNTSGLGSPDLRVALISTVHYSLIGDTTGMRPAQLDMLAAGPGNIANQDALLGPLAYNGGPVFADGSQMLTHALLAASPAIDAGDPAAVAGMNGVPEFDQRGEPYGRVLDGDEPEDIAIDIGAYEREFGETYTFVVDTLADESDGDYSLDDFSLREAIELANANPGADAIEFDPVLWAEGPATILLTMGELQITDSLMIDGPGAEYLTIDASGNDLTPDVHNYDGTRVLNILGEGLTPPMEARISGLAFTGGDTVGSGGAIRSTVDSYFDHLYVWDNHAADGGGIHVSQADVVEITNSDIQENEAGARGGGIELSNSIGFIRRSTIVGNRSSSIGGGLSVILADVLVENSTISRNQANSSGGGIFNRSSSLEVRHSMVVYNQIDATGSGNEIGGIDSRLSSSFSVFHTIVAGNTKVGNPSDLSSNAMLQYSLIGFGNGLTEAPVDSPDANGNLIGGPLNGAIDPMLGPLVNNGGPTKSHTLLPGSPAIDAGDPLAVAGMNGVPEFDQRGMPWGRVANGDDVPEARIDIGAVEWQLNPLPGDYNFNGVVDAADYSVWRDTLGSTTDLRADGSSESTPGAPDGVVDAFDYAWWKANFGSVYGEGAGSRGQGAGKESISGQASSGTQTLASITVNATQPPALPGVASVFGMYLEGASVGGVDAGLPPAEPGAGGRSRASSAAHLDAALLAWVARRDGGSENDQAGATAQGAGEEESPFSTKLEEAFAELGGGLGW